MGLARARASMLAGAIAGAACGPTASTIDDGGTTAAPTETSEAPPSTSGSGDGAVATAMDTVVAESDTGTSDAGSDTTGSVDPDDGASETGGEPVRSMCRDGFTCGNGIVEPGEGCDDGNADDTDGCTGSCERAQPIAYAPAELGPHHLVTTVDADGSIVVASRDPAFVARLSPEGDPVWTTPLEPIDGAPASTLVAVLVGQDIVVAGNASVGALWRLTADGSTVSATADALQRQYIDAARASDDGVLLLAYTFGDGAATYVEQQTADGWPLWSRTQDEGAPEGLHAIALASDGSAFVAGGIGGAPGQAAVMHVTPDAWTSLVLAPPEHPNGYLYAIAAVPEGGAVATGDASDGSAMIVRVDADGELLWVSTCTADGVMARDVAVVDDRVLAAGWRDNPDCNFFFCEGGEDWPWIQHLDLDGSLIATDAPDGKLIPGTRRSTPAELVRAIGRHPDGSVVAAIELYDAGQGTQGVFVAHFPW